MNRNDLKLLMVQKKEFLKNLFLTKSTKALKSILLSAHLEDLDLLLNILFFITQGDIPIKKVNFQILQKTKKISILHKYFQSEKHFKKILISPLKEKTMILIKFLPVMSNLLYPLFKSD